MNRLVIPVIFVVLLLSATVVMASADTTQRFYVRVKSENGKSILGDAIKQNFSGNIVSVELPKKSLQSMATNSNDLEILGEDYKFKLDATEYGMPFMAMKTPALDDENNGGSPSTRSCKLSDPMYGQPQVNFGIKYMYDDMGLTRTSGGNGVKVAILDTGANISHPDIAGRVKYCKDVISGSSSCDDTYIYPIGHGTGVAGVVAANAGSDGLGMWGMAPQADLYIITVCHGNSCWDSDVATGIYDAVNHGVNIISMSFAGPSMSPQLKEALDYASAHNVLLVASAGNKPDTPVIGYPAAYSKVMAVGGIREGYDVFQFTSDGFNNNDYVIGEGEIDVAAPAVGVWTTSATGCYLYGIGTSYASPHISGLAAKVWDGSANSTRARILNSARLHDLYISGDDNITGFGLPTVRNMGVPPVISKIVVSGVTSRQATINWTTNIAGDSIVKYGSDLDTLTNQATGIPGTSHSINITGLTSNTTYYFLVSSTDASGHIAQSIQQSFTTIPLSPLLRCGFENNLNCDSGKTGTGLGINYTTGKFGSGVLVDSTDRLYYSSSGNINKDQGTIMMWINPQVDWSSNTNTRYQILDTTNDANGNGIIIVKYSGSNDITITLQASSGSSVTIPASSFPKGSWHHLALTYGGGNIQLYIDGVLTCSNTYSGSISAFNNNIYLGQRRSFQHQVNAVFDEFRIYGEKLGATEIAGIYNTVF